MRRYILLVFGLATSALAACGEGEPLGPRHTACDPLLNALAPAAGDTVSRGQGLRYIDLRVGAGPAVAQWQIVDVNYSLYNAAGGARLDSSCPADRTVFRVIVGSGSSIEGFWRGIEGMQPGGVRRVIVPPALGYGGAPGHELREVTLVFDIELVDVL